MYNVSKIPKNNVWLHGCQCLTNANMIKTLYLWSSLSLSVLLQCEYVLVQDWTMNTHDVMVSVTVCTFECEAAHLTMGLVLFSVIGQITMKDPETCKHRQILEGHWEEGDWGFCLQDLCYSQWLGRLLWMILKHAKRGKSCRGIERKRIVDLSCWMIVNCPASPDKNTRYVLLDNMKNDHFRQFYISFGADYQEKALQMTFLYSIVTVCAVVFLKKGTRNDVVVSLCCF